MHLLGKAHPKVTTDQNNNELLKDGIKTLHQKITSQHEEAQNNRQAALDIQLEQMKAHGENISASTDRLENKVEWAGDKLKDTILENMDVQNSEVHSVMSSNHSELTELLTTVAHTHTDLMNESIDRLSNELGQTEDNLKKAVFEARCLIDAHFSKHFESQKDLKLRLNWLLGAASVIAIGVIGIWVNLVVHGI